MSDDGPAPGPLIAHGRSADIFDLGGGTVLRRDRRGPVAGFETAAMKIATEAGFPVPTVHLVDGRDMVLDHVDGRDMLSLLGQRPWRARRYARTLADLQIALRAVDVDGGVNVSDLPAFGAPEALVHGDLHPGNVLLAAAGPVVIDWEGARLGPRDADAALVWLLTEVAELDDMPLAVRPIARFVRRSFVKAFLDRVGRPRRSTVDLVCTWRADGDPNMRPAEVERIRAFAREHGTGRDTSAGG